MSQITGEEVGQAGQLAVLLGGASFQQLQLSPAGFQLPVDGVVGSCAADSLLLLLRLQSCAPALQSFQLLPEKLQVCVGVRGSCLPAAAAGGG